MIGEAMEGKSKWYGGIVGGDGAIYGIPYTAEAVLRIEPGTEEVTTIGQVLPRTLAPPPPSASTPLHHVRVVHPIQKGNAPGVSTSARDV